MKAICFASPKGGVGKTTLTANMAYALQRLGLKVTVIDLDMQNALRLHFGMALDDGRGFVAEGLQQPNWRKLAISTPSGVRLLPFGDASEAQRRSFDSILEDNPDFFSQRLAPLLTTPDSVLLIDTAPGPTPALKAALQSLQPIQVAVLAADSASLALLPAIEKGQFFGTNSQPYYILNQCNVRSTLSRDIALMLKSRLGQTLLGSVHRDEAVPEAHALQSSVFQHAESSAVADDLEKIAKKLHSLLLLKNPQKAPQARVELTLATGEV